VRHIVLGGDTNGTMAFRSAAARGGIPLRLPDIRSAGHADTAIAPLLRRDPLDGVVAVTGLVEVRPENAVELNRPRQSAKAMM